METVSIPVSGGRRLAYKWVVALVVVFGAFMSILDQTVVNNAVPALQKAFGVDLSSVQWVLTAYTLTQGVVTPTTAFFADRLGSKRFYIIALGLFTLGSVLCSLAWNLPAMIVFRIVQGIGGAVLFPLSIALLFREFPPRQRGLASAILGIAALTAPAAGPTLGGYFVTYATWQWIFFINLPLGIIAILMAAFLLREVRSDGQQRFDRFGFVLVAGGLAAILYAFSLASSDGWSSLNVFAFLGAGLVLLAIFCVFELLMVMRGGQPLLDLRIFTNRPFLLSNIANATISFAFFGSMILSPVYLQTLRGLDAFRAGLLTLPLAFTSIIAAFIGGRMIDRIGPRVVLLPGIVLMALTTWLWTGFTLDTSYEWLIVVMAIRGVGLGFLLQPLTVAALSEVEPRRYAQASSLNTVVRFVFSSLGVAVLATVVQTQASAHIQELVRQHPPTSRAALALISQQGLNMAVQDAFWLSFWVLLVAGVVACFLKIRRADAPAATSVGASGEQTRSTVLAVE